jgi:hypothetical protein
MEDLNRFGPPQIKLAGFEIWIHRRQFRDDDDYWDGNWVYATARCSAPGAEVSASGPIIHLPEIERWHDEVARMQRLCRARPVSRAWSPTFLSN